MDQVFATVARKEHSISPESASLGLIIAGFNDPVSLGICRWAHTWFSSSNTPPAISLEVSLFYHLPHSLYSCALLTLVAVSCAPFMWPPATLTHAWYREYSNHISIAVASSYPPRTSMSRNALVVYEYMRLDVYTW